MICTCVDIDDPAFDQFLTEAAMREFKSHTLSANVMQLLGLFHGKNLISGNLYLKL